MLRRVAYIESRFKQWTKPAKRGQIMNTLTDLKRNKSELIAENLFLRQQLIVLERQVDRPKLTQHDRRILVLLASRIQGWREALVVVKPDTVMATLVVRADSSPILPIDNHDASPPAPGSVVAAKLVV
jgi:hypothetical protein